LVANDLVSVELSGLDPDEGFRSGQHHTPIYALADGSAVNVLLDPRTDGGFALWCKAMDRPELAADPRFATPQSRADNRPALDAELAPWVASFTSAAELEAAIGNSSVAVAEVRSVAELAATPWAAERGAFVDVPLPDGGQVRVPQSPWRFTGADTGVRPLVGFRGEHNNEVLGRFATPEELADLEAAGVLSARPPLSS
jgi:crotonobetainyl-CoA:carnitine CoA-transferase CaiB-like acyl-CoA transferase